MITSTRGSYKDESFSTGEPKNKTKKQDGERLLVAAIKKELQFQLCNP